MRTITTLAAALLFTCALGLGSASAQGDSGSSGSGKSGIGLGAEATLTGIAGAAFLYDAGPWHLDVVAGFDDQDRGNDPHLYIAGRFFWVLHNSNNADFSVGGGVGFLTNDDDTDIHLEGGAQIRVFLADNVALTSTLGIGIVTGDNDRTTMAGRVVGALGIGYYFF